MLKYMIMFVFLLMPHQALSAGLVAEFATNSVEITTGFSGDTVKIYGAKPKDSQIVAILIGPDHDVTLRQKEKTLSGWRFTKEQTYQQIPSYYNIATHSSVTDVSDADKIGHAQLYPEGKEPEEATKFDTELLAYKQGEALYHENLQGVTLLSDEMFKAEFLLPHNVVTGDYKLKLLAIDSQGNTQELIYPFEVTHVGLNAMILDASKTYPALYAILCIAFAIIAGFVSNRLKRIL